MRAIEQDDMADLIEEHGHQASGQAGSNWESAPLRFTTLPSVGASAKHMAHMETTWSDLNALYTHHAQTIQDGDPSGHSLVEFDGGRRKDNAVRAYGVLVEIDGARWSLDECERVLRDHGLCG